MSELHEDQIVDAWVHYLDAAGKEVGMSPLARGPSTTYDFHWKHFMYSGVDEDTIGCRMLLCLGARCFLCKPRRRLDPPRRSDRLRYHKWEADPTRVVHIWGVDPETHRDVTFRDVYIEFGSAEEAMNDVDCVVRANEILAYPVLCCKSAPCFLCSGELDASPAGEVYRMLDPKYEKAQRALADKDLEEDLAACAASPCVCRQIKSFFRRIVLSPPEKE